MDGAHYQWVHLDGEGLPGILTEQADGWFYKHNLSANNQVCENGDKHTAARFAPLEVVAQNLLPPLLLARHSLSTWWATARRILYRWNGPYVAFINAPTAPVGSLSVHLPRGLI